MIETVLSNVDNEEIIASVRHRVNETMKIILYLHIN